MATTTERPQRGSNCRFISKRIREIDFSNDVLRKGIADVQGFYSFIETTDDEDIDKDQAFAVYLNEQNLHLAKAIMKTLKGLESILIQHHAEGIALSSYIILEFQKVLEESIKICHEYEMIQEKYKIPEQDRISPVIRETIFSSGETRKGGRRRKVRLTFLQRVFRLLRVDVWQSPWFIY